MISQLRCLIAFSLLLGPLAVQAMSVNYAVNRSFVDGSLVTGTITTDGTLGVLSSANLQSVNLTAVDQSNDVFTLDSSQPTIFLSLDFDALSATTDELLWDPAVPGNFWISRQTAMKIFSTPSQRPMNFSGMRIFRTLIRTTAPRESCRASRFSPRSNGHQQV